MTSVNRLPFVHLKDVERVIFGDIPRNSAILVLHDLIFMSRCRQPDLREKGIFVRSGRPLQFFLDKESIPARDRGQLHLYLTQNGAIYDPDPETCDVILVSEGHESATAYANGCYSTSRVTLQYHYVWKCVTQGRLFWKEEKFAGYKVVADDADEVDLDSGSSINQTEAEEPTTSSAQQGSSQNLTSLDGLSHISGHHSTPILQNRTSDCPPTTAVYSRLFSSSTALASTTSSNTLELQTSSFPTTPLEDSHQQKQPLSASSLAETRTPAPSHSRPTYSIPAPSVVLQGIDQNHKYRSIRLHVLPGVPKREELVDLITTHGGIHTDNFSDCDFALLPTEQWNESFAQLGARLLSITWLHHSLGVRHMVPPTQYLLNVRRSASGPAQKQNEGTGSSAAAEVSKSDIPTSSKTGRTEAGLASRRRVEEVLKRLAPIPIPQPERSSNRAFRFTEADEQYFIRQVQVVLSQAPETGMIDILRAMAIAVKHHPETSWRSWYDSKKVAIHEAIGLEDTEGSATDVLSVSDENSRRSKYTREDLQLMVDYIEENPGEVVSGEAFWVEFAEERDHHTLQQWMSYARSHDDEIQAELKRRKEPLTEKRQKLQRRSS